MSLTRLIRSVFPTILLTTALIGAGCLSYGNPGEGECGCDKAPVPTCADATTLRTFSTGECVDGECVYPHTDEDCGGGACVDGVCTFCQPECGDRTCGTEPVCGAICGLCPGCDGQHDPDLCDPAGFCMQVCCPDCTDRACGPDGCGGSCGACPDGEQCGYDGQCEPECEWPVYSWDCAEVPYFQCGIDPRCEDGVLSMRWHEHIFCEGMEEIVDFQCEHVCPMGCDPSYSPGWPESGAEFVAAGCLDSCDDILLDNGGAQPATYPPQWAGGAAVEQRYLGAVSDFLTAYDSNPNRYRFEPHPITSTPEIDHIGGEHALVVEPGLTENTIGPAAEDFFAQWTDLFATAGITKETSRITCSSGWCRANLQQTYCGLSIASDDSNYSGHLRMRVDVDTGGLLDASSAAVPMIQIPAVPHLDQDWVRESLVGLVLEYWCADGIHTVEVTDNTTFTFEENPIVFVRTTGDGEAALEIRTAYRLRIQPEDIMSWVAIVDAFDGILLKVEPEGICD